MNLKTVIQSEVNQKEKKNCIVSHKCAVKKNGVDKPVCRAGIET